jgi:hypothetical protein
MPDKDYSHRSLLDKLGIKPGARVSVLDVDDVDFMTELADRAGDVSLGGVSPDSDAVLMGVEQPDDMARMAPATLGPRNRPRGRESGSLLRYTFGDQVCHTQG